ncbi:hypothetical protein EET67_07615 [Pseudaminobacter arsenicus]|uniref:Anti-sigma factor n=1 Tax=Borborobacter arsenicus TaxID=1851146 RepID=A0A432V8I2_9HYPH|nr:hypothetical protein [Pseudaminobacter arsenicus]RUM98488.1 hypothetical protein EET67_07615 [Pseudaminobacter arsenicus]
MVDERDRMARASKYVLGLMDEDERERAERDLEHDPAFLDAMVRVAERMHLFDLTKPHQGAAPALWKSITAHLTAQPQIGVAGPGETAPASSPAPATPAPVEPGVGSTRRTASGWRLPLMALSLLAACGLGYAAGSVGTAPAPADCGPVQE